jgi:hypothetical protein
MALKFFPVSEQLPTQASGSMYSDLLIVKTSDGMTQTGYLSFCNSKPHSWTVCRDRFSDGSCKPSWMGDNYHVGCFNVEVVEWASLPTIDQLAYD